MRSDDRRDLATAAVGAGGLAAGGVGRDVAVRRLKGKEPKVHLVGVLRNGSRRQKQLYGASSALGLLSTAPLAVGATRLAVGDVEKIAMRRSYVGTTREGHKAFDAGKAPEQVMPYVGGRQIWATSDRRAARQAGAANARVREIYTVGPSKRTKGGSEFFHADQVVTSRPVGRPQVGPQPAERSRPGRRVALGAAATASAAGAGGYALQRRKVEKKDEPRRGFWAEGIRGSASALRGRGASAVTPVPKDIRATQLGVAAGAGLGGSALTRMAMRGKLVRGRPVVAPVVGALAATASVPGTNRLINARHPEYTVTAYGVKRNKTAPKRPSSKATEHRSTPRSFREDLAKADVSKLNADQLVTARRIRASGQTYDRKLRASRLITRDTRRRAGGRSEIEQLRANIDAGRAPRANQERKWREYSARQEMGLPATPPDLRKIGSRSVYRNGVSKREDQTYLGARTPYMAQRAAVTAAGHPPIVGPLTAAAAAGKYAPPGQERKHAARQWAMGSGAGIVTGIGGAYGGAALASRSPGFERRAGQALAWKDKKEGQLRSKVGLKPKVGLLERPADSTIGRARDKVIGSRAGRKLLGPDMGKWGARVTGAGAGFLGAKMATGAILGQTAISLNQRDQRRYNAKHGITKAMPRLSLGMARAGHDLQAEGARRVLFAPGVHQEYKNFRSVPQPYYRKDGTITGRHRKQNRPEAFMDAMSVTRADVPGVGSVRSVAEGAGMFKLGSKLKQGGKKLHDAPSRQERLGRKLGAKHHKTQDTEMSMGLPVIGSGPKLKSITPAQRRWDIHKADLTRPEKTKLATTKNRSAYLSAAGGTLGLGSLGLMLAGKKNAALWAATGGSAIGGTNALLNTKIQRKEAKALAPTKRAEHLAKAYRPRRPPLRLDVVEAGHTKESLIALHQPPKMMSPAGQGPPTPKKEIKRQPRAKMDRAVPNRRLYGFPEDLYGETQFKAVDGDMFNQALGRTSRYEKRDVSKIAPRMVHHGTTKQGAEAIMNSGVIREGAGHHGEGAYVSGENRTARRYARRMSARNGSKHVRRGAVVHAMAVGPASGSGHIAGDAARGSYLKYKSNQLIPVDYEEVRNGLSRNQKIAAGVTATAGITGGEAYRRDRQKKANLAKGLPSHVRFRGVRARVLEYHGDGKMTVLGPNDERFITHRDRVTFTKPKKPAAPKQLPLPFDKALKVTGVRAVPKADYRSGRYVAAPDPHDLREAERQAAALRSSGGNPRWMVQHEVTDAAERNLVMPPAPKPAKAMTREERARAWGRARGGMGGVGMAGGGLGLRQPRIGDPVIRQRLSKGIPRAVRSADVGSPPEMLYRKLAHDYGRMAGQATGVRRSHAAMDARYGLPPGRYEPEKGHVEELIGTGREFRAKSRGKKKFDAVRGRALGPRGPFSREPRGNLRLVEKRDSLEIKHKAEHPSLLARYGDKGPLPKGLDRETKMKAYEARYVRHGGDRADKYGRRAERAEGVRNVGLAGGTLGGAGWLASRTKGGAKLLRRAGGAGKVKYHADTAAVASATVGGAAELYGEYARGRRSSYTNSPAGVAGSALRRMRDYTPE